MIQMATGIRPFKTDSGGWMNKTNGRQYSEPGDPCVAPTNLQPQQWRNIMAHKKFLKTFLVVALLLPMAAWAAPQVNLSMTAEKDVVVEENGKKITKRIPVTTATPGDVVIYSVLFANVGDETATNVVVSNPIPEGTAYLPGTASEPGEVTFSIDGGKSYNTPALLKREVINPDGSKELRVASPEEYTDIRWQIPAIAAGGSGKVIYQVQVK
jgi:uncharacterized repeat protein (TIGR01451 family)